MRNGLVNLDGAAGALLGLAAGDALGAGYEFTVPAVDEPIIYRTGQMGFAPGEWTDDTAQAVGIALVNATGKQQVAGVGEQFLRWHASGPKDCGISTGAVLRGAGNQGRRLTASAAEYFASNPKGAAGNGSLMRTSPVAIANLGQPDERDTWARAISLLTHGDPLAAEACVLWCAAIDAAITSHRLSLVDHLDRLPPARQDFWRDAVLDAERGTPSDFAQGNGFVVTALQAAWSAITHTPVPTDEPACHHLQHALEAAVRIGNDTDTVAAIAGQLLGAYWGESAVPWRWRRQLHGWGARDADDLIRLAVLAARGGQVDSLGWPDVPSLVRAARASEPNPLCAADPDDPDLLLGNLPGLPVALEQGVDAVISLCRVGTDEVPERVEQHRFRLIDRADPDSNPNLDFVLEQAVEAVLTLRDEGKRVFLHCHGGRSRSATVAAAVRMSRLQESPDDAIRAVRTALPEAKPNPAFAGWLRSPA